MKLENKVAIVTGGGKGIGAEICLRLAKDIENSSVPFGTLNSTKLDDKIFRTTIATFAGSIATISRPSLFTLKVTSFTSSEAIAIGSFRYFGSARTNFMRKSGIQAFKSFIVVEA